ncbi:hypothetical protein ACLOJK_038796 [Asimina triloba]
MMEMGPDEDSEMGCQAGKDGDGGGLLSALEKKMEYWRDRVEHVILVILGGLDRPSAHPARARRRQPWLPAMEMTMEHHTAILRFMVEACWAPMLAAFSMTLDQADDKAVFMVEAC